MRRSIILWFAPVLVAAFVLAASREARAGVTIGAEYNAGQQIDGPSNAKSAFGFVGGLGYRFNLGPIFLQPEVQGSYMTFPTTADTHVPLWRALGGGRFGLGGMFQPSLYGHAGVGWRGADVGNHGKALDCGFMMAFKLIPVLIFGGQIGYNVASLDGARGTTKWVSYGAHLAVEL